MDTFVWSPMYSTQGKTTPRVLRARFGDGYEQINLDGINALLREWNVVFDPVHANSGTTPTFQQLKNFFESNAGLRFLWTQPKPFDVEGAKLFECAEWTWSYTTGLMMS